MADNSAPPSHIDAASLFRLLSTRERPCVDLGYRLPLAPDVLLRVQGLRGPEMAAAYHVDSPDRMRGASTAAARVVACSLLDDDGLAFGSAGDLGGLTLSELTQLGGAVHAALATISPTYGRSDIGAWSARLTEGAKDDGNYFTAITMANCTDVVMGMGGAAYMPRPDRYYGKPVIELTDGQLMAYRAAWDMVNELRGDNG